MQITQRHSLIERHVSIERGFTGYIDVINDFIRRRWECAVTSERSGVKADGAFFIKHENNGEEPRIAPDIKESVDSTGRLLNQQAFYGKLVNAEVWLQSGELMQMGKVIGMSINHEGAIDGSCNDSLC